MTQVRDVGFVTSLDGKSGHGSSEKGWTGVPVAVAIASASERQLPLRLTFPQPHPYVCQA